jgi:hypothetical protein
LHVGPSSIWSSAAANHHQGVGVVATGFARPTTNTPIKVYVETCRIQGVPVFISAVNDRVRRHHERGTGLIAPRCGRVQRKQLHGRGDGEQSWNISSPIWAGHAAAGK